MLRNLLKNTPSKVVDKDKDVRYTMHLLTKERDMTFEEANKAVHPVETQWHYPILTKFGWLPETKEGVGFVRSYVYKHPSYDFLITCTTGASADYWERSDTQQCGYWASLEPELEKLHKG